MKIERRSRWDGKFLFLDVMLQKIESILWKRRKNTVVECIGDSHVKVLRRLNWSNKIDGVKFRTTSVMGATIYGLSNENSSTKAVIKFKKKIKCLKQHDYLLILIGEIDCGFLIWFLSEKKNVYYKLMMEKVLTIYFDFIEQCQFYSRNIIICSVPLPTLKDGIKKPNYLDIRNQIDVSQKKRTKLTLEFNKKIKQFCLVNGISYVDLDEESLDSSSYLARNDLLSQNVYDHHYDEYKYSELLSKNLKHIFH